MKCKTPCKAKKHAVKFVFVDVEHYLNICSVPCMVPLYVYLSVAWILSVSFVLAVFSIGNIYETWLVFCSVDLSA